MPDLAEYSAILNIDDFLQQTSYALDRECHLMVAMDGFAFNDIFDIPDSTVHEYVSVLKSFPNTKHITFVGLNDHFNGSIDEVRKKLLNEYALPNDQAEMIASSDEHVIKRCQQLSAFAKNDLTREDGESKKAFKRRTKEVAYQIWYRSEALSELISDKFRDAIRLSIHPHSDKKDKWPINLVPSVDDHWRTPWHSSAIRCSEGNVLLCSKKMAEENGLKLVNEEGRPWAFSGYSDLSYE